MAQNDQAVITAAKGFVFTAPVGTAAPTPAELEALDPVLYGAQVQTFTLTGTADSGTFTITIGAGTTTALPYNATAAQVAAAIGALAAVGAENVSATGTLGAGIDVSFIGTLQGTALATATVDDSLLVGTTPEIGVTVTAPLLWKAYGHTSRETLPEWGFEGGDAEILGTWQNAALREVESETPADFVLIQMHQFDRSTMEMYYGDDAAATPGIFGVAGGTTAPNERALLIIIQDGDVKIGFYAIKVSLRRDDSIEMSVDEFAVFPVRATFLKLGNNRLYDWINEDLFA